MKHLFIIILRLLLYTLLLLHFFQENLQRLLHIRLLHPLAVFAKMIPLHHRLWLNPAEGSTLGTPTNTKGGILGLF